MPLRYRLILPIAVMLLVSLTLGGGLAWLHAVRSVSAEMDAALAVGRHTLETVLPFMEREADAPADLRRVIATFDGDRHLRAVLLDGDDRAVASSSLFVPAHPVPRWFGRLLGGRPPSARIALPPGQGAAAILLQTDAGNELTEVWTEFGDDVEILLVFGILTFPMLYWIAGRALRPLSRLAGAFSAVGPGIAIQPIAAAGPPELSALARGFNAMIDRLAQAETRNRRLNEQLVTIQEEERAELARDLHDEIGPYLFAMSVDMAAIETAARDGGSAEIATLTQPVRESVSHIQRQVREILVRLRAGNLAELGLRQGLENLAGFWRSRRAGVTITLSIDGFESGLDETLDAAIYRIVQESLSNAMRHGDPRRRAIRCIT